MIGNKIKNKISILMLFVLMFTVSFSYVTFANQGNSSAFQKTLDNFIKVIKYEEYTKLFKEPLNFDDEYIINAVDYTDKSDDMEVAVLDNLNGDSGKSLHSGDTGYLEYTLNVKKAGYYNIELDYFTETGKSGEIQRAIFINNELPFQEARLVLFERFYKNETNEFVYDNQGNSIRPKQVEENGWASKFVYDSEGYYVDPLKFYLNKGENKITIMSLREPVVLKNIKIYNQKELPTYAEYLAINKEVEKIENYSLKIEAEKADLKSSPMLYPIADNSSPAVTPFSSKLVNINTIGGNNFSSSGQWIQWNVDVAKTGMYRIDLNVRQDFVRGSFVSRKLTIDGSAPFKECNNLRYLYEKGYSMKSIGDENGAYTFYLTEGTHNIRIEATLGEISEYINDVEVGMKNLNDIYREIIMITGPEPDRFRDYQIAVKLPYLQDDILAEANRYENIINGLEKVAGKRSDREAVLVTIVSQLKDFAKKPESIPLKLGDFKTNIGGLGTWLLDVKKQPIQIDSLYIKGVNDPLEKTNNGLFTNFVFGAERLYYSFIIDYSSIGNVSDTEDTKKENDIVTIWLGSVGTAAIAGSAGAGRDQADTIKSMIDESFTPNTGIKVNLMLVQMDSLLPATLSGQGPDIAMRVTNDLPMNYGMRGAVQDLSIFKDYEEIEKRFHPSAMVPYSFEGEKFALPETETFNTLFYRKDILEELGLDTPKTWDDVKADLSVLSKNYLAFGMAPATDMTYGTLLFQNGGEFYTKNGVKSALDSQIALDTFKEFTAYYTDYTLEREFDFVNRFRTGEMPIGIADYTLYNTLQVSAPEIRGLWGFTTIPGTIIDGKINNTTASGGSALVMLKNSKVKDNAWEFMKWWTSAEIQGRYGKELEAILGPSARYPTANIEAIKMLPWPNSDYKALEEQYKNVKGIQQVPGGYYTTRNLNNAFYKTVVDKKLEARESLRDAVILINDEITHKRKEFSLSVDEESKEVK